VGLEPPDPEADAITTRPKVPLYIYSIFLKQIRSNKYTVPIPPDIVDQKANPKYGPGMIFFQNFLIILSILIVHSCE
jgi:hypothetical protein